MEVRRVSLLSCCSLASRESLCIRILGRGGGAVYSPAVPIPVHSMEFFNNSVADPERKLLKQPILGYGEISKQTTVEKMDMCICVGVEKDAERNSVT